MKIVTNRLCYNCFTEQNDKNIKKDQFSVEFALSLVICETCLRDCIMKIDNLKKDELDRIEGVKRG